MNNLVIGLIKKPTFVNLLTILIVVMGIKSIYTLKRAALPKVSAGILEISAIYPGASPSEVEKLVTNPIEKAIKSLNGVDKIDSFSFEGGMTIQVKIDPDIKNQQKVMDDVKDQTNQVFQKIPTMVDRPTYLEHTDDAFPIITIAVSPKKKEFDLNTEKELRKHILVLEGELLDIDGVSKIERGGWRKTEMQVNIDPKLQNEFEVTSDLVINAIRTRNVNSPGGTVFDIEGEKNIRTIGEFDAAEEIAQIPIRSNEVGRRILVKDVANVVDGLAEAKVLNKVNGEASLSLVVYKSSTADIVKTADKVMEVANRYQKKLSDKYRYTFIDDLSDEVNRRLGIVTSNAIVGFILVVICLFLFLNFKIALMAAMGIPLAIGIALTLMDYFGASLNLISLLGLIIVLGIMVDDAIIIGENIYSYIEAGFDPYQATVQGTLEVILPVLATISTTIAAFAPLLFISGILGSFIYELPLVVIFALLGSFFEAMLILPSHIYEITKNTKMKEKTQEKSGSDWFQVIKNQIYIPVLRWCLINNKKTIYGFLLLLILAIVVERNFIKYILFPNEIKTLSATIEAPAGYSLYKTEKLVSYVEKSIDKLPKESIKNYFTDIGNVGSKKGKNYASIKIDLHPIQDGMWDVDKIIGFLKKDTEWLLSKSEVLSQTNGLVEGKLDLINVKVFQDSPSGKPVDISIIGNDFSHLKSIANELKSILKDIKGVHSIEDNFNEGSDEFRVKVDYLLASQTGVNVQSVADAINTAYLGKVATKIKRIDEEIDVRVFLPRSYRSSINSLDNLYITNQLQNRIPISQLINYKIEKGFSGINHLNGKRVFSISAMIKESETSSLDVNNQIQNILKERSVLDKYPGYQINYGGEYEESAKNTEELMNAFIIAFFAILMILSLLFGSLSQSLLILSVIPFTLIGVIFAFFTHNEPLGFMPFLGVVGLCGVVINDSIVLVDKANAVKKANPDMNIMDVLLDACSSRLRAVLLTTITTILGLFPTAYGIGGKDKSIMLITLGFAWGLLFGSIIILIFIPVLYQSLENFKAMTIFKKKKAV